MQHTIEANVAGDEGCQVQGHPHPVPEELEGQHEAVGPDSRSQSTSNLNQDLMTKI
jgi:hypothetical protein